MNFKLLFDKAKEKGITDVEIYQSSNNNTDLMVFNGAIDRYTVAESLGVSVRGIYNGKMGYAYSEKDDENIEDYLIDTLISAAKAIDNEDVPEIYAGDKNYVELDLYKPEFFEVPMTDKIEMTKELERKIKAKESRISAINYLMYQEGSSNVKIANSKGLDLEKNGNYGMLYVSAVAKEGNDNKTAAKFILSNKFEDFDIEKLSDQVSKEAVSLLGAKPVESGEYPVILRNNVATTLLSTFSSIFSAQSVQDGTSKLRDKLNTQIASKAVNLVDDPHNKELIFGAPFDDEGVATKFKEVIKEGNLTTYLYNIKTARKANVEPTGNGFKNSYKGSVVIRGTNFYFKPGQKTLDQMISEIDKGLLITDIAGYHAGANPVTGDFSLQASGFLIENGIKVRGVSMITIAGNYFELLQDIVEFSDDLEFGMGGIGSASIKLNKLSIAG